MRREDETEGMRSRADPSRDDRMRPFTGGLSFLLSVILTMLLVRITVLREANVSSKVFLSFFYQDTQVTTSLNSSKEMQAETMILVNRRIYFIRQLSLGRQILREVTLFESCSRQDSYSPRSIHESVCLSFPQCFSRGTRGSCRLFLSVVF